MSDEHESDQSDQSERPDESDGDKPSPQERLEDVGAGKGTYEIPGPGEGGERESGTAGLPEEDEVPDETLEEIETDRSERLDPDNRPDGAEVDNTPRTFDAGAGMFTDNPDYDKDSRPYAGEEDSGPPEERPASEESTEQASSEDEPARSAES
jgi:hypothetical protein